MKFNMSNPFGSDEIEDDSNESKEVDKFEEVNRMLMEHIKRDELKNEIRKEKAEDRNKQRREDRKIKKIERIARIMPSIREKHVERINEIVSEYVNKGYKENEILIAMMKSEGVYLSFAHSNRYITYEESLEEHYVMFLSNFKMGD